MKPTRAVSGRGGVAPRFLLGGLRLALGAALVAWVVARGDLLSSAQALRGSWSLLFILLVPVVGAAVEARRLGILYGVLGISLPFTDGYRIVTISTFFNFAVPGGTGGDVAKIYYLVSANRERRVEAATVVGLDRAVALFAWLLLTLLLGGLAHRLVAAHPVLQAMLALAAFGAGTLLGFAAAATSATARQSRLFRYAVERAPLHRFWARVADALYAYRHRRGAWMAAILWSLAGHLALLLMFLAVARTLLPAADGLEVALLCFIGMLANALPITPGGLGVGEVAFDQLFGLVGIAGGAQLVLAWRVAMVPLGILGAFLYVQGRKPARQTRAEAPGRG